MIQPNTTAHRHINPGVLPTNTQGMHPCTSVLSQSLHYTCKNQYTANKFNNVIQYYTSVCRHMPISPGVPRTFPVGFLAHCSRLPSCAGCTSSTTCSTLWGAGDGLAPQTGWGPLHVQSQACALPEWMLDISILQRTTVFTEPLLEAPPSVANLHTRALHARNGVHEPFETLGCMERPYYGLSQSKWPSGVSGLLRHYTPEYNVPHWSACSPSLVHASTNPRMGVSL